MRGRRMAYLKCTEEPGMVVRASVPVLGSRGSSEEFKAILRHTVSPTALSYTKPCLENKQKPK